jgi:hypothetical protein
MKIKGENVRNMISRLGNQSDPRPDRGRLSCMTVGPLSRSATIKVGHAGAQEPMFTMPTVPPQTLAIRSDREGAEARGTAHSAATTVAPFNTDDTDSYYDHRHRHVVFFVGSRYL